MNSEMNTPKERDEKPSVLAQFLKDKRVAAGLSQRLVAEKLGYSTPQFISNWERGVSHPPISTLKTLAQIYNVSADEIFEVTLQATISEVTADLRRKFFKVTN